jgi:CDGSH-type Zn-finger protein
MAGRDDASGEDPSSGPPTVTPRQDGPVVVEGTITVVGPDGSTTEHTGRTFLCRCGGSADKPFCDGTHKRTGFTAAGVPVPRKPDRP